MILCMWTASYMDAGIIWRCYSVLTRLQRNPQKFNTIFARVSLMRSAGAVFANAKIRSRE